MDVTYIYMCHGFSASDCREIIRGVYGKTALGEGTDVTL